MVYLIWLEEHEFKKGKVFLLRVESCPQRDIGFVLTLKLQAMRLVVEGLLSELTLNRESLMTFSVNITDGDTYE